MATDGTSEKSVSTPGSRGDFIERARINQSLLTANLRATYDVIVCGAGSSGSVIARRLAANPDVHVLLLEAGTDDAVSTVTQAMQWPFNLGTEQDWSFIGEPGASINGRSLPFSMGKGVGGGSRINAMIWARGHKSDWDHFAAEAGDQDWGYDAVLDLYRNLEDWHGAPDPHYRGTDGPLFVQPALDPHPLAPATVDAARSIGIPSFEHPNGRMMEADSGAAISDILSHDGLRSSVFRSYTFPYMDRPNLTVLTNALVHRVTFDGTRATGVEVHHRGELRRFTAGAEVVLSLGAIHTPKVLMQSGIGDQEELSRFGIPVRQHLAGVGRNFQDHVGFNCNWEFADAEPPRNNMSEMGLVANTGTGTDEPDVFICQAEIPLVTPENRPRFGLPEAGWTLQGAMAHPKSRGRLRLSGPNPADPIRIDAQTLSHPDDVTTSLACVQLMREIGNSAALRPFVKREAMPGELAGSELQSFLRDAATTFWHECGTAKMGRDTMSVVDSDLKVYGCENLRVADASIMPRITTANTMAACVVIGERAARSLAAHHRF